MRIPGEQHPGTPEERATTEGILGSLAWLLDDSRPTDQLVLFLSGQGAQICEYNDDNEPDRTFRGEQAVSEEPNVSQVPESPHLRRWQNRLMPFMLGALIFMTVFFLIASLLVFFDFRQRVTDEHLDLAPTLADYEARHLSASGDPAAYIRWKASVLLEQDLIVRRYKQATSIILARVWTRYLGFLTGMTLAMVGAFFVLGQLRTAPTSLQTKTSELEATLTTSSPGLVLATLGTVLMAISLFVTFDIETRDVPTYVHEQPVGTTRAPPPELREGVAPGEATRADELINAAPEAASE